MYEGPRSLSRAQVPMSGGPRPYVSGPQGLCLRAPSPYVYGAQMGMYGNSTLHLYGSILCEILHQMKMMSGATWVRSKPTRGVGLEFWEQIPAHQRWRSGVTRCRSQPPRGGGPSPPEVEVWSYEEWIPAHQVRHHLETLHKIIERK